MKKLVKVAMALGAFAMALMFSGCQDMAGPGDSKPVTSNEGTGSISGKAIYQEGVSDFSGITIVLEKLAAENRSAAVSQSFFSGRAASSVFRNAVTKADGSYEFTNLPDGNYTVYAANNDEAAYRSVTITEGAAVTVEDLKLVLKGSLSGTLQVTGGSAAGSIVGVAGTSYIAFVDENGKFTISGIPAGKHKLCVMTNGKYQAFPTEYTVDGKTTTKAGVLSVTIENTSTDNGLTYVTATATERGIYFSGTIPSNVMTNNSNSNGYTDAICSISIWEAESGISMHKDWTRKTDGWADWNMTYPLVNTDKEYNFNVTVSWHNYTFYSQSITITATGGLGEFRIENKDKYDIELTADRVVQNTGKPEFTENDNVKIKRVGTNYYVNKYKTKPSNFWENGSNWVYDTTVYDDYNCLPLKDVYYLSGWREPELVEAILSGNWYGIRSLTRIEIAGYSEDDNIYFEMNDEKLKFGEWGGQRKKVLVEYGYSVEGHILDGSYTTFEYYSEDDKISTTIKGLPGTKRGSYKYTEVYDFDDVIYEPQTLPEVVYLGGDTPYSYRFRKWDVTFPFNLQNLAKETVDGTEYYVQKITADFVPVFTADIKFMMNDGTSAVYATKKISTEKNANYDGWPNWASLDYFIRDMKEPVRKGYKFIGWFIDKECTRLVNGLRYGESERWSTPEGDYSYTVGNILYAGWAKEVSVKLMDGSKTIDTVKTYAGEETSSFTAPEKSGYIFTGWYSDSNLTNPVTTISSDTTILYARYAETVTLWTGKSSDVKIDTNKLAGLSVNDTLYVEVYYDAPSTSSYSGSIVRIQDGNKYNSRWLDCAIKGGESKIITYLIEKDDYFLENIKSYGLYVYLDSSYLHLKKVGYIQGPNHGSNNTSEPVKPEGKD